jgi:DNA-binding XRE family transcriptional regulator
MPRPVGAPRRPGVYTKAEIRSRPQDARRWLIARLAAGLTQTEVQNLVGVPRTYLSDIERGMLVAGKVTAARLRAAYGLDDDQ